MEAIITAITTAVGTIQTDVMSIAAVVVPVALVIWGTFLAVRFGKKFFSSVAK